MANFNTLWSNFPDKDEVKKVCFNRQPSGDSPHDNYCAILLSECFMQSGIKLNGSTGVKCWSHSGQKHIIRAEEFAAWLTQSTPAGFGKTQTITPTNFQSELSGKTGVVFFKDYWTRGNESFENRSGDHIDLWNRSRISEGSMTYRSIIEFFGFVSDLNKSRKVLFWEVK